MTRFAILLGGTLTVTLRLRQQLSGARIVAADSGIIHATALGVTPELWVGDFDSTGLELAGQYAHIPRQTHTTEKDTTDGGLAIAAALTRGARELVLVGGFGGQADHTLGHFGQMLQLAHTGLSSFITSGNEEAHPVLPGFTEIDVPEHSRISLIPFTSLVGLDLSGVKWPLVKRDVPLGSTLTLSNVAHGPVRISLQKGYAIAITYPSIAHV